MPQLDWDATIESIRETLPQTQFQNWFKPLTLIRCDENSVVLGVPSRFHEEWVRNHYGPQLSGAIKRQTGCDLQLSFEVLVEVQNAEAAQSRPESETPQRPSLRVLDGGNPNPASVISQKASGLPEREEDQAAAAPNLPIQNQPYLELDFNRVANQCTLLLADQKVPMNPLILQAGVGMGKTHLLCQLGARVRARNPRARIRYTTAESFMAEMVAAIKCNDILPWKNKYREHTDLLLFDDLQGLSRKLRTQEELVHIFNDIVGRGGAVAFATTVAPNRLEEIIDPLRSRLVAGVIAEVKSPTYEERVQLLTKVCEWNHLVLDPLVLTALADKGHTDIRELVGTLLRVHLQAKLEMKTLDATYMAQEGFAQERITQSITMDEILGLVEHNYAVPRSEMCSKSRKANTNWARQVAMYLARHYTLMPLEDIGKFFGRDHATVIHAFQKVTETMESQPTRRYEVEFLKQKLQNRAPRGATGDPDAPNL